MPRGDKAIYREATGTESLSAGVTVTVPYDTTVVEDPIFSIDAGRDTVTVSEAGHYLCLYNHCVGLFAASAARIEINSRIKVNGSATPYGRSSGHIDSTIAADDRYLFCSGSAILSLAANDTVEIEAQRTDSNVGTVARAPDTVSGSALHLVKLSEAWDFCRLKRVTSDPSASTSSFADFEWNSEDELDTGSFAHSTSTDPEEITLVGASTSSYYLVTLNVYFRNADSGTTELLNMAVRAMLDDGGGFVEIPGSRVTAPMKLQNSCVDSVASWSAIVRGKTPVSGSDNILKVQYAHEHTGNSLAGTPKADLCAITIAKLVAYGDGNYILLREVTGGQVADTAQEITWDSEDEDGSSYDHDTSSSSEEILINDSSSTYLFLATLYADRTAGTPTAARIKHQLEWQVDTGSGFADSLRGDFGQFQRGDASGETMYTSGMSGGLVIELASGDLVRLHSDSVTIVNDPACVYQGGMMALQAVNLDRLLGRTAVISEGLNYSEAVVVVPSVSVSVDEDLELSEGTVVVLGDFVVISESLQVSETTVVVVADAVLRSEPRGDLQQESGLGDIEQGEGFRADIGGRRM